MMRDRLMRRGWRFSRIPPHNEDNSIYEAMYPADSIVNRRFYNIGAGGFRHEHWTNVDHASTWYTDRQGEFLEWDLLSGSPLAVEDSVAELVYSSHTIEHVPDEAASHLFGEARRILKPGGVLRVTAPDIALAYVAYRRGDRRFFPHGDAMGGPSIQQLFLYSFASARSTIHPEPKGRRFSDEEIDAMFGAGLTPEALDRCVADYPIDVQKRYPGDHMNWFTPAKVREMLTDAGFVDVVISGFGQSRVPVLRNTGHFDSTAPALSLYLEATRPR